jgi:hypothetical protein
MSGTETPEGDISLAYQMTGKQRRESLQNKFWNRRKKVTRNSDQKIAFGKHTGEHNQLKEATEISNRRLSRK